MALLSFTTTSTTPLTICNFIKQRSKSCLSLSSTAISVSSSRRIVRCCSVAGASPPPSVSDEAIVRRSANYRPSNWSNDFVQTLNSEFSGSSYTKRIYELKDHVMTLFDQGENPSDNLELIATLKRLGIAYHFEDKIKTIFTDIYNSKNGDNNMQRSKDLYSTALEFRLLREYGFEVPQEVFNIFKDDHGNFKESIHKDIKGVLSLYDASFLLEEGENILEDARAFSRKLLEKYVERSEDEEYYSLLAKHSLEFPFHWRMLRLEARWFIDAYQKAEDMNPLLLEFAKLDFNKVQAVHQEDLKPVTRWWDGTGLVQNVKYIRDRLVICFYWGMGVGFQPDLSYLREVIAKNIELITAVDDVFDVYGTIDELEQFTAAIESWDASAVERLPDDMKRCFLSVHNFVNDMGLRILKEQGVSVIPHLKQMWTDFCKAQLTEAKWFYTGYIPTLQEYLDNAWISGGGPSIINFAYYAASNSITEEAVEYLRGYPNMVRWGAMMLRLENDLGTASDEIERGDVAKSIQCYMRETGASEAEAREHIKYLINEVWKNINRDQRIAKSTFSRTFAEIATNLARMALTMYQYGDGHGHTDSMTKDRLELLLLKSIH